MHETNYAVNLHVTNIVGRIFDLGYKNLHLNITNRNTIKMKN